MRVLISADTTSDVVVRRGARTAAHDIGNGTTYPLPMPSGVKRWRITVGAGNKTVVGYLHRHVAPLDVPAAARPSSATGSSGRARR